MNVLTKEEQIESEVKANGIVSVLCMLLSIIVLVYFFLIRTHLVESTGHEYTYFSLLACDVILALSLVLAYLYHDRAGWMKYILMFSVILTSAIFCTCMGNNYLVYLLPIVLCSLYYRKAFSVLVSVVCVSLILLGPVFTYAVGIVNYNYVEFAGFIDPVILIKGYGSMSIFNEFMVSALPSALIFLIASMLSIWLTEIGRDMLIRSREAAIKEAMIERDVSMASDIQSGMLPAQGLERQEFSIAARMYPAKIVGGDFYDFFMVDDSHLAFMVADVSGKGVPAAMFMASALTLIRSNVHAGTDLAMAMNKANRELVSSNSLKYFVTVWIGVLDLRTGTLEYIDAGHNPPFIRKDGGYALLECRPDFVFGRKNRIRFNKQYVTLVPGDRLFLYTDGVTEAVGPSKDMYGEDRLRAVLDSCGGSSVEDMIGAVRKDLLRFAGDEPQSDDVTTLCIEYCKPYDRRTDEGITVPADREGYSLMMSRLHQVLTDGGCDPRTVSEMETVCSEVFANIDMYAYGEGTGDVHITMDVLDGKVRITFEDTGAPFNPLEHQENNPVDRFNERLQGGLGIMIVKRICDDVMYVRRGDRNILTLEKEIS